MSTTSTVATFRRRREDSTLTDRLEALLTFDPVAHKALGALLAASLFLPFGDSYVTFESALSVEVLGPVAVLLLLGLLLVLDCRDWAQEQVTEAARQINGSSRARVSNTMELSSDTTQNAAYHVWLKKIPAVRAHPWLIAFAECAIHLQLALKEGESCSWVQNTVQIPCTVLLLSSAVASTMPRYCQVQSHLAFLAAVAAGTSSICMMVLKDKCFPSMVNERGFSLTIVVAGSVLHSVLGHLAFPVMMNRVPALAAILWVNTVGAIYIAYLNAVDTSGDRWAADPGRWVLLLVAVCATMTQLASVSARYYITCVNMKAFFRHVIPKP